MTLVFALFYVSSTEAAAAASSRFAIVLFCMSFEVGPLTADRQETGLGSAREGNDIGQDSNPGLPHPPF